MMNLLLSLESKNLILGICVLILILIFLVMLMNEEYETYTRKVELGELDEEIKKDLSYREVTLKDYRDRKITITKDEPVLIFNNKLDYKLDDQFIKFDAAYFDEPSYKNKRKTKKIIGIVVPYLLALFLFVFSLVLILVPSFRDSLIGNDVSKFIVCYLASYEFLATTIAIIIGLVILDLYVFRKEIIYIKRAKELAEEINNLYLESLSDTKEILISK